MTAARSRKTVTLTSEPDGDERRFKDGVDTYAVTALMTPEEKAKNDAWLTSDEGRRATARFGRPSNV